MSFFESIDQVGDLDQLQNKVSEVFALLAASLLLFLGVSDYFLGLSNFIVLTKLLFSLPFGLGYVLMRNWGRHQLIIQAMIGVGLCAISINYFSNDGYKGPTFYTMSILVVAIVILIKGWPKVFWLVLVFTVFIGLFWGEINGSYHIPSNYTGPENLFWDHSITLLWCGLFSSFGIYVFIKNYRRQNQLMLQTQQEKDKIVADLESLNSKKNQLIALLSHDLKNPIGTLSSTLELMDQGVFEKDELEKILLDLKGQSFHLHKILNNTLNWVLAELEDRDTESEFIRLKDLTREIMETMKIQAERKNQVILLDLEGEDMSMEVEVNEIKIILKNLLDNAIKFSPLFAEIHLRLSIQPKLIRWEIKNPGKHISEEAKVDLFEFKVKSSVGTHREKGTGIGLPLCKKISDKLEMKLGYERSGDELNLFFLERKIS